MANVDVFDMSGAKVSTMDLADSIFCVQVNQTAMHTAVTNYLANQRQGTQSALTRAEVSGGGIKPWRQKGTGPGPAGINPQPAMDPRRRCFCAEAPGLPFQHEPEGKEARAAFCAFF